MAEKETARRSGTDKTGKTLEKMKMLKAYSASRAQKISERMRELAITKK